jgi:hypothetical protein
MKRVLFGLVISMLIPALAAAQAAGTAKAPGPGQKLILEFADGADLTVVAPDKSSQKLGAGIFEGDEIAVGSTISTGPSTTAELRLKPNGTIIKLAKSTIFTVSALAANVKESNAFALAAGKLRAIASKGAQYKVTSQSAVCAVRGTDFSFSVEEGAKALLMVAKGLVQFDQVDSGGASLASIPVAAGEAADAFAAAFASFKYSADQFAEQYGDVAFQKLRESDVPDVAPEAQAPQEQAAAPEPAPAPEAAPAPEPDKAVPESGLMKWLRESLGFEIGSVTIDDRTYSKAIIQPNLKFGKARLGLYLPVIYSSNLLDPADWYRPGGNYEWSFGYDQFKSGDALGGVRDFATDLALKIKYFEYGTQLKDPFFVKVGNLEDLTLGHGLVMRDYANDTGFPSVRRLGFNVGFDGGGGGFEALVNDVTDPQVFGARVFFRPVPGFKLAIGASAAVDWNPAADAPGLGLPDGALKLIGTGVDLDLPIINTEAVGLRAFADGAAALPYVAESFSGVSTGLKTDLVYSDGKLRNWGAATGLLGNLLFLDWRLEYRYFTGAFRPSLFDGTYDRMRSQYAAQYLDYLTSATDFDKLPIVMGIYGEGGFKFMNDKLTFKLGYMWPWSPDASSLQDQIRGNDEFHARLAIKKGLIPIVDLAGAITYDKRGLAKSIADGNFKLLDADSVFGGEILVPVPKTPNLDLAIVFQTVPVRDSSGAIIYADKNAGIPELKPSISIETRFHF